MDNGCLSTLEWGWGGGGRSKRGGVIGFSTVEKLKHMKLGIMQPKIKNQHMNKPDQCT